MQTPISTKVICFCHLLKCFKSFFDKQCRLRSAFSCMILVHTVCLYAYITPKMLSNMCSRQLKQQTFSDVVCFAGASRVKAKQLLFKLLSQAIFFTFLMSFEKYFIQNFLLGTPSVSNSLDTGEIRHFVRPGPEVLLYSTEHEIATAHKN